MLFSPAASAQTRIYEFPAGGTCYEVIVATNSHGGTQTILLPFPFCPIDPSFVPLYSVDDAGICIFCGLDVTWGQLQDACDEILDWESSSGLFGMEDGGGTGDSDSYGPSDFYLELLNMRSTNQFANLLLHATVSNEFYQLEFKTNIDQSEWTVSQIRAGDSGTNATLFLPEAINGNPHLFFRAHHANIRVSVDANQDGIETNSATSDSGQPGIFQFSAIGLTNDLAVGYRISGVASNGSDYTNISGVVTIPASTGSTNVFIQPIEHHDFDFDETVTLTILSSNKYLINPDHRSATLVIHDNFGTNIFSVVASKFNGPSCIDYHPPTQSLIVGAYGGDVNNFWRIETNGNVSPWSPVTQVVAEVKFAIVKQTAAGFTNGEIYFDTSDFSSVIGRISSNGLSSTNNWLTLDTVSEGVQGGFYLDQSGVFGNDLIALVNLDLEGASVWRIKANGTATNLASFPPHIHFEGVITLTNDAARWGPWAGKIITGSEEAYIPNRNLIRAIDTNGVVSTFDLGIISLNHHNDNAGKDEGLSTERFDLIPPNQDLYLAISSGEILKVSRDFFTNYVGDLLMTQGGNYVGEPELFIVHWNGSDFVSRGIPLKFYSGNTLFGIQELEGTTFAPISV